MPKSVHHLVVSTSRPQELVSFLEEVVGVPAAPPRAAEAGKLVEVLGWPPETTDTTATLVGEGTGMIEVVGIPPAVVDLVPVGLGLVGFAVRDLDAVIARCRGRGYEVSDPVEVESSGRHLRQSVLEVAGVRIELLSF